MVSIRATLPHILLSLVTLAASSGCGQNRSGSGQEKPGGSASASAPPAPAPGRIVLDLAEQVASCDLEHRGLLLDVGSDAMTGRFAWTGTTPQGVTSVEHDASTWMRAKTRSLKMFFVLPEAEKLFVSARSMGITSRVAMVSLDDQPLGTLNFQRNQIRVATTNTTSLPVDPGLHTLTFRFMGGKSEEGFADLDWVRVGIPDENPATFGPPTLRDVIAPQAALSGVPHRSIRLRGPGALRCPLRLPPGARLRTAVGVLGPGEADAVVRIVRDGQKPVTLLTQHITGGEKATWTDVDLPLDPETGNLVTLELGAEGTAQGARVLFGDPAITLAAPPPPATSKARAVVVVVMNGIDRADLPPWHAGPTPQLTTLSDLAHTATTFHRHRAPTSFAGSVVASMLTSLPPRWHTVTDLGARLPESMSTLGVIAHDASIRAAMFTGVPSTFKAFGFSAGWERFSEYPSYGNDPATAPLDAASTWVTDVLKQSPDARLLVVVHARGGHPPWDISQKELNQLAPQNYTGIIEARRGAQQIATWRKKKDKKEVLSQQDAERIRAFEQAAFAAQDRALGGLVQSLKAAGIWENTLFVLSGDVGTGAAALYAEGDDLAEARLTIPLYVRFPDGRYAGANVKLPTEAWDITQTALSALGISFSRRVLGRDLSSVASGLEDSSAEPQIATLDDRYSARWGDLIMTGRYDAAPQLCDLELDPTCAFNRRETMPFATQALFRRIMARDRSTRESAPAREPATIDAETASALRVWGAIE